MRVNYFSKTVYKFNTFIFYCQVSGKLFLIVGPSGVGKGTLVNILRERYSEFYYPPSVTTRPPRDGEVEGEVYRFISDAEFEKLKEAGELLEWAVVHATKKYATLKQPILEAIKSNKTVIREVDIQGLKSIQQVLKPTQFTSIFISPPDLDTIRQRILKRQPKINPVELERRLSSAETELAEKTIADYEVISREGKIEELVTEVLQIINSKQDLVSSSAA